MIIRAKAVSQDIKLSRTVGPRGPQEKPVWVTVFCRIATVMAEIIF